MHAYSLGDPNGRSDGVQGKVFLTIGVTRTNKAKTVVEATTQGRSIYASEGFEVEIEQYAVQLSGGFAHKDAQSFT